MMYKLIVATFLAFVIHDSMTQQNIRVGSDCPPGYVAPSVQWCKAFAHEHNVSFYAIGAVVDALGEILPPEAFYRNEGYPMCVKRQRYDILANVYRTEYSTHLASLDYDCPVDAIECVCINASLHIPVTASSPPLPPPPLSPRASSCHSKGNGKGCTFEVGVVRCEAYFGQCVQRATIGRNCLSIVGIHNETDWHSLHLVGRCTRQNHTIAPLSECIDDEAISDSLKELIQFTPVALDSMTLRARRIAQGKTFESAPSTTVTCTRLIPLRRETDLHIDYTRTSLQVTPTFEAATLSSNRRFSVSALHDRVQQLENVGRENNHTPEWAIEARSESTVVACSLDMLTYSVQSDTWVYGQDDNLLIEFRLMEALYIDSALQDSHRAFTCGSRMYQYFHCLDIAGYDNSAFSFSNDSSSTQFFTYGARSINSATVSPAIFGQQQQCGGHRVGDGVIDVHDISLLLQFIFSYTPRSPMIFTQLTKRSDTEARCDLQESKANYLALHLQDSCNLTASNTMTGVQPPDVQTLHMNLSVHVTTDIGTWHRLRTHNTFVSADFVIENLQWPESQSDRTAMLSYLAYPADLLPPETDADQVQVRFARHCEYIMPDGCAPFTFSPIYAGMQTYAIVGNTLSIRQVMSYGSSVLPFDLYIWEPRNTYNQTSRRLETTQNLCIRSGTTQPFTTCTFCGCSTIDIRENPPTTTSVSDLRVPLIFLAGSVFVAAVVGPRRQLSL